MNECYFDERMLFSLSGYAILILITAGCMELLNSNRTNCITQPYQMAAANAIFDLPATL